ncbi:MAG TPA: hypothetical protein VFR81_05535 [Longimicrobium sp.]|nr:hypothetical protein [Longimicrobium sp.]
MTDLMVWAAGFEVPRSSDARPRKVRFTAATLPAPEELRTDRIRAVPSWRRPSCQAISIDVALLTAGQEEYRALGLALLGYALSEQKAPLRIHLPQVEDHLHQIVLWPGSGSRLEARLGFRFGVREVHYRARILEGNPNYSTHEQDDDEYPREHLPYCTLSPPDWSNGYPGMRPDLPLCLHFAGTSASLVWLGKFLLNVSLADSYCRRCYLYNINPGESLAEGGAELRFEITDPPPAHQIEPADAAGASAEASGAAREGDPS